MGVNYITNQPVDPFHPLPPSDISRTIPFNGQLDFIFYAVARERFGQPEIFYEYQMEEGAQGNFQITLPRPPGLLAEWTVIVYGYRENEKVFAVSKNASEFF